MIYQYMYYYCSLVYIINGWLFLTVIHFFTRIVWDCSVYTKFSYYHVFSCSKPALHICDCNCPGQVLYIDAKKITVLRFVWDCLVFIQYSYYRDLFCSGQELRLCDSHHHIWVCYIDTIKLRLHVCHFWYCLLIYDYSIILSCFILNWPMVQWWNGRW